MVLKWFVVVWWVLGWFGVFPRSGATGISYRHDRGMTFSNKLVTLPFAASWLITLYHSSAVYGRYCNI